MSSTMPWYLKAVLYVGLPSACLAALYLSIPGEVALARTAGWSEQYSYAMPVCLSVYALVAGAIATYRRKASLPGQATALAGAIFAGLLAMSAQSISHLIAQDYMGTSAVLVVAVSCVPPLTIFHLVHMAETPSEVQTADEKLRESQELNRTLMVALVASESASLTSYSSQIVAEVERASERTEELTEWASQESEALSKELEEAQRASTPKASRQWGKVRAITRETVEGTVRQLQKEGAEVKVATVADALGISTSSWWRLPKDVRALSA
ncbi:DUF2637 domain-containing protein [Streptomyces sp. NPDC057363]|uniref:DUF2637 domain-containing protein n=1 Tax=Streptomyces sp. NPDC057363 TaxID=3346107 RepID=UPI00362E637A